MAVLVEASGTLASGGHTIGSSDTTLHGPDADAKTFVYRVNLTNMATADRVVLTVTAKVLTGGSEVIVWSVPYVGAQTEAVVDSIPVASPYSVTFKIRQTAGTLRAFEWAVLSL